MLDYPIFSLAEAVLGPKAQGFTGQGYNHLSGREDRSLEAPRSKEGGI